MQKPDLSNMWEFFIKIPTLTDRSLLYDTIRLRVRPILLQLRDKGIIEWFSFLVHDRESGVPTTEDDRNIYFHVRVSLKKGISLKREDVNELLPKDFEKHLTGQCTNVRSIKGIDTLLMESEDIAEVWRIIGEQSEWVINMLGIFKEGIRIPIDQVAQFLHYYSNMT